MSPVNNFTQRFLAAGILTAAGIAFLGLSPGFAADGDRPLKSLSNDQKILHVLNRLEFGPRPGDLDTVRQIGIARWIDQQLSPERIDDSAVEAKLAALPTLRMSPEQLFAAFQEDQMQNRMRQLAAQEAKKAAAGESTSTAPSAAPPTSPAMRMQQMAMRPGLNSIEALGELNTSKLLRACESKRQLQEVLVDFWSNHFNLDVKKGPVRAFKPADERDVIRPHVLGKFRDLLEASAKSPAMLFYLDNASSTRDFSDPRTAPPNARPGLLRPGAPQAARRGGLNENYARELMELHTLGVDGGYTQKDVQEVARCFTGWSIDRPAGRFRFYPFLHDHGEKMVLGHRIPAGGGIEDGETVLDLLASHPATAHHLSFQLCQRLVADEPSVKLVDHVAAVFQKTGGDLRAVVRAIVTSREFLTPKVYDAKMKSPFEYAVSAVRALDGKLELPDPTLPLGRLRLVADGAASMARGNGYGGGAGGNRVSLAQEIARMGQPLFSHEAPTGYPEDSREWISSGALLARFHFSEDLASNRVAMVTFAPESLLQGVSTEDHQALLKAISHTLLGCELSTSTREAILKQMDAGIGPAKVAALVLGSPEFQRR